MANDRRKQTGQQLLLRFQEGTNLRDRLEQIARANGRSTTAEVLLRLERSLKDDDAVPDFTVDFRLQALEADVAAIKKKLGM
ncbi:Arc family DNA-binding protein [Sinorhizobium fredii]|uniref:Arc family DNA-binding protein n=1 Tax=Rhizobium fredii TaxID=380 RepID=UPI00059D2D36|nr:Arc family DNA-binding protein [Sinorhizobium fredii]